MSRRRNGSEAVVRAVPPEVVPVTIPLQATLPPTTVHPGWEYLQQRIPGEDWSHKASELGAQGWELVQCCQSGYNPVEKHGDVALIPAWMCFFRRRLTATTV